MALDLVDFLKRHQVFSQRTFGPGHRTQGVLKHLRKELDEIEAKPLDLVEWIDAILIAIDGACRTGASPEEVVQALVDKQTVNEKRDWPDWRSSPYDEALEHDRTKDGQ